MLAAALWWAYFAEDERRAEHRLASAPRTDRLGMALGAYFYAYLPILLGVITLAAGLQLAVGHVEAPLAPAEAVLLGGGVALYLAGGVAFRRALGIASVRVRVLAAAVVLVTVPAGIGLSALAQLVALVAMLIGMLLVEARAGQPAGGATSRE